MAWVYLLVSAVLEALWATALGRSNGFTEPVVFAGDSRSVLVESRATNLAGVTGADLGHRALGRGGRPADRRCTVPGVPVGHRSTRARRTR